MKTKVVPEKIVMGFHYQCGCYNNQVFTNITDLETVGVPECAECDRILEADAFWEIEDDGVIVEKEQTLENWYVVDFGRFGLKKLHGNIHNDSRGRFEDGQEIFTSTVFNVENGRVHTKSGSVYKLGSPSCLLFNIEE